MIATSQTLASAAGLRVFHQGGNAIDAAVTAAAVLAVIEPNMNGIGGDLLAIVYDANTRKAYGLDSTGRSAYAATPAEFAKRGLTQMPTTGVLAVDVPGVIEGWHQLLARFGTTSLADAMAPAIAIARDGFPVAELMANDWANSIPTLSADPAAAATFLPDGKAPQHGDLFANPRLARSMELIAKDGRDAFYTGSIARAIVADIKQRNGLLDMRDFADHAADWIEPLRASYRGVDVLEMPPSTQGFVALEMLNIMEGFDLKTLGHNSAEYLHVVTEAKRIAFADRSTFLADRDHMAKGVMTRLLSKDYAASRRGEIDLRAAKEYGAAREFSGQDRGDTIYLSAADGQGNVISLIQSLFAGFGAGFVAGDTGITMHNRGSGFYLTPGHPNQIGPHKRPLHTLVPAMIMKDDRPWVSFGVMGGDNQAQAHAQIVANFVDFGMHVQEAGDAARMRHGGGTLALESGIGAAVRTALEAKGHVIRDGRGQMGGYQAICIDPRTGVLLGGSDLRKDGLAIGW
ncbi:MAG TPA: gamma-glutamyltransferase [Vicinamibacterales bacterium]|nr:gamma-glutamyltransferase [Vicinamibacterales bacterium]